MQSLQDNIIHTLFLKAAKMMLGDACVSPRSTKLEADTDEFTQDIKFSPLEANISTNLATTQIDKAEVNLSVWALLNETPEQEKAQAILKNVAVKWWA